MVTLTGQVADPNQTNLTVTFTGVATGQVVTANNGSYSFTVRASGLGNIQDVATDQWGQHSTPAQATVSASAPTITNFTAIQGVGNIWTLEGQVTDQTPQGLVVQFAGLTEVQGQTATVQSNGWFYFTFQLQPGDQGQ